ncbi:MAG: hypothetical protein ACJA0N_002873 [Pseudohongiellaceae bacterium]|jgi:hypothetical protein
MLKMLNKRIQTIGFTTLATISAITFSHASTAALTSYNTNFESSPTVGLIGDGWKNFIIQLGGVNGPEGYAYDPVNGNLYNGPQGAPAGGPQYGQVSAIATGQGGQSQGDQVLTVYSDYDNAFGQTGAGISLETNVFQEQLISAGDVGSTWTFSFDAKKGNIEAPSIAAAFIKVLKSSDGSFNLLSFPQFDATDLNTDWDRYSVEIPIDPVYVGELLQFGFLTNTTGYNGSANFYDNVDFNIASEVPVPAAAWLFGSALIGLVGMKRKK